GSTQTAEIYNSTTNAWRLAASQGSTPRTNPQVAALADTAGSVLVAGGQSAAGLTLATAETYNPQLNTWSPAASMATARSLAGVVRLSDGRVMVAGGINDSGLIATVEIYNPATNTWSSAASMSVARYAFGLAVLPGGRVLAAGGTDVSPGAEIF